MKSHFFRDLIDRISGAACDSCDDLKSAAKDKIVDPLREAGNRVSHAARDKAEEASSYARRAADRTEEWISDHQTVAGMLILGAGIITGCLLYSKLHRSA